MNHHTDALPSARSISIMAYDSHSPAAVAAVVSDPVSSAAPSALLEPSFPESFPP